jgi:hypothetical protein
VKEAKGRPMRALRLLIPLTIAFTVAATSTAAASAGKTQAPAASGPPCNSSFDPYKYTQAQVQACGYATFSMLAGARSGGRRIVCRI